MVAVRMKDLSAALGRLDDESRALLDLSLRRGTSDDDIATVLRAEPGEVARRRGELLDWLAGSLGLESRDQRDELYATLQDLPDSLWQGG